jgi:hypothetical protein
MAAPSDVVIDTRPLWQLLISRGRQPLLLLAGAVMY